MIRTIIVDSDYGSIPHDKQVFLQKEYAQKGIDLEIAHYTTPEEIIENAKDAEAILGTGNPPLTREVFEQLPNLKIVQRFGIGVNSIDLDAATEHGVFVLNMPGFSIEELAVHATGLILSLLRNITYYDRGIRRGEWPKAKGAIPRSPNDLTLGLFGFGGSAIELYEIFANGFGTKIMAHDPFISEENKEKYKDVSFVSFDELLSASDIVSIHAPATKETRGIFNYAAFEKMKSDAMIINIARGDLINQKDLIKALENKEIQFAGLDVFENEPLEENSELIDMDNVVLTPHSAFYGVTAQEKQVTWARDLVTNFFNDQSIPRVNIANKGIIDQNTKIEML